MPGEPVIINDRLIVEGGWIARPGARVFNQYKPPTLELGDADKAGPWCDLVRKLWPDEAEHLFDYFAHRVQRPGDKINHALVLGGAPGIGKDTVLAALLQAVGPWNVQSISPPAFVAQFNAYARAVVLVINEARDNEYDRYKFYEHMKIYAAAPPDVLRVNEKYIGEYYIPNLCAPIITTNYKTNGIYLPADDRRHFVAWSDLTEADFTDAYWQSLLALVRVTAASATSPRGWPAATSLPSTPRRRRPRPRPSGPSSMTAERRKTPSWPTRSTSSKTPPWSRSTKSSARPPALSSRGCTTVRTAASFRIASRPAAMSRCATPTTSRACG